MSEPSPQSEMLPGDPANADVGVAADGGVATGALEAHRLQRHRSLKLAVLTSIAVRPLALATSLVAVPLFLTMLGDERFGLSETISALGQWVAFTNAGLTCGLYLRLTDCSVSGDQKLAQRYVSSFYYGTIGVVLVTLAALSIATPLVDWRTVLNASARVTSSELAWSVWVAGALTLVVLVIGVPNSVYMAYQEIHLQNLWDGASKVATLLATVVIALLMPWLGIVGVIIATTGMVVLVRGINLAHIFTREKPFLRPRLALFDFKILGALWKAGVYLFLLQIGVMMTSQLDKLIANSFLGPTEVARYTVLARLFLPVYGVFNMLLAPLWAAYGEAVRRHDYTWIRRAVRVSSLIGVACAVGCGLVMLLFGQTLIPLWTRSSSIHISHSMIIATTCAFILRALVDTRSIVLNAREVLLPQVWLCLIQAALHLVIASVLTIFFGLEGTCWAVCVSAMLTTVWGYFWMMRKYIYGDRGNGPPAAAGPNPTAAPTPTIE